MTPPILGLIAPRTNHPVPSEGLTLYPSAIRFSVFGLGLKTMTPDGFDSVIGTIAPAAQHLARDGADAISIFGTSLTFYRGAAFNQKLIDDVRQSTGLQTTSMSTAVVEGLKTVGARCIAVATAYNDEVNRRMGIFLGEHGFDVVAMSGLGIETIGEAGKVSQTALHDFSLGVLKNASKADALVVSCGGLRTLELIEPLENACRIPVISSTPHALWAGMRSLGLHIKTPGYGRLLAEG